MYISITILLNFIELSAHAWWIAIMYIFTLKWLHFFLLQWRLTPRNCVPLVYFFPWICVWEGWITCTGSLLRRVLGSLSFPLCGLCCVPWTSYQIRKMVGCACTGNAGKVFPCRRLQWKPLVRDPGMHHDTCVTHVPWCMSGSLTRGGGEIVPAFPAHAHPQFNVSGKRPMGRIHIGPKVVLSIMPATPFRNHYAELFTQHEDIQWNV